MDKVQKIRVGDNIYYMRRGNREAVYTSDSEGDWLAGAGYIVSITTKNGDRIFDKNYSASVVDVESVRVMPHNVDDTGYADPVTLFVGEFTYNFQNFLNNLIS